MRKLLLATLICGLVTVVTGTPASASEITFNGLGYHQSVHLSHNGNNMHVQAGECLIDIENNDAIAYCVDLDHWLRNNWEASFAPVTYINGGLAAAYLYDHFAGSISNDVQAAGLQVAIWEIVDDYGSGLGLTTGDFRLSGSPLVAAAASTFLAALPGDLSGYTTPSFILASGPSPQSQNLIVPEPATWALVGMTFLPALIRRRG